MRMRMRMRMTRRRIEGMMGTAGLDTEEIAYECKKTSLWF
jgi:hypothetical protein